MKLNEQGSVNSMQTLHAEAESILSRFPGPVTLYSSRKKWLRLILLTGLTAAAGLLMVIYEISGGWFFLVFFAALSILGVARAKGPAN